MINIEENDLIPEIEQQLALINQETDGLENDLKAFKSVYDELGQLRSENQDLKERLVSSETEINSLNTQMKERDQALVKLLNRVKDIEVKIREIRTIVKT